MSKKKNWGFQNWSTDRVLSISAFFISIISLIALLYQSYLAREEYKLMQKQQSASVMPYLNQFFTNTKGNYRIVFGNDGLGPAFIRSAKFTMTDSPTFTKTDDFLRYLAESYKGLDTLKYTYSTMSEGTLMPANSTQEMVSFQTSEEYRLFYNVLVEHGFNFEIEYEDVYGERWRLRFDEDIPQKISN